MSRSGYFEGYGDEDPLELGRWRAQVASATRGKRGQALLRAALAALDAMPVKELITNSLLQASGAVCTLGAVGLSRGVDMTGIDPEDWTQVAAAFDIAEPLAREIMYENDEGGWAETPAQRWKRMRAWIVRQIKGGEAAA